MKEAYELLKRWQRHLTKQEYKTFKGQIKAGDITGFKKGLSNLLRRKNAI